MATNNQRSVEIIEGEVTQAFAPSKNDAGTWRPANIYIETAEGKVKISEFPRSDYDTRITFEPIQMPAWYVSIGDVTHLVGAKVQVAASYKNTFEGTREYNRIQTFKVLSSLPTPQPSEPPAQQGGTPNGYAPQSRQEIGMATGNAKNGGFTVVAAYYEKHGELPSDEFLIAAAGRVNFFAEVLLNGHQGAENAPEQPVEAPEPNADPEPFPEHPGEDDTVSNMGVFEA
jgi:hypothetical protein